MQREVKRKAGPARRYALPPCPSYDVAGMEAWLTSQAAKGWFLRPGGIAAGVFSFEKREPVAVKYRLSAALQGTSLWSDNMGDPSPDEVELSEKYNWEYLGKRGQFYIWRSFDEDSRELHTDPAVQAQALRVVKKRMGGTLGYWIVWAVYLALFLRRGVLYTVLHLGTPLCLLAAILLGWMFWDCIASRRALSHLQKSLLAGNSPSQTPVRRGEALRYHGKRVTKILLAVCLVGILLSRWNATMLHEDLIPVGDYAGKVPFATLADFAGGEVARYEETMAGLSPTFNMVGERSDWLMPRYLSYNEHARLTLTDGRVFDGGYYVDYYEMAGPGMARELERELLRQDRHVPAYQPLELPESVAQSLPTDYASVYLVYFPTVLLRQGNLVLRAQFYQLGEYEEIMEVADWVEILAASLAADA